MSKYGDLIQKARKPESKEDGKPALQSAQDREVNLSIKVLERNRRYWVAQAKLQGTSLTAAIIDALSERFGVPE